MLTVFFFGESKRESVFLPFPASRGCWHSLALDPLPSKPATAGRVFYISHHSDSLSSAFLLYIKDIVITLSPLGYNSEKYPYFKVSWLENPICNFISLLPCKVTYRQIPRVRMWTSLGTTLMLTAGLIGKHF